MRMAVKIEIDFTSKLRTGSILKILFTFLFRIHYLSLLLFKKVKIKMYISIILSCMGVKLGPPLWSSGQSSIPGATSYSEK
jgi:hypothetical protein